MNPACDNCKTPSLETHISSKQLSNVPTDLHAINPDDVDRKKKEPNEKAEKNEDIIVDVSTNNMYKL